jgi:hypothetical protein
MQVSSWKHAAATQANSVSLPAWPQVLLLLLRRRRLSLLLPALLCQHRH